MKNTFKIFGIGLTALFAAANVYAMKDYKDHAGITCVKKTCAYRESHWFFAGGLGVSHLYDKVPPGVDDSVDENGPGWDVSLGYMFNHMIGTELGYTQYYNSRETHAKFVVGKTTHFAVHLDAIGEYEFYPRWNAIGKLGIAYAYAQIIIDDFNDNRLDGASDSSGSVSPYMGLGIGYALTETVQLVGQWSFVRGNDYTGSNTLYSLGLVCAIT